jgi:hypothetical protein
MALVRDARVAAIRVNGACGTDRRRVGCTMRCFAADGNRLEPSRLVYCTSLCHAAKFIIRVSTFPPDNTATPFLTNPTSPTAPPLETQTLTSFAGDFRALKALIAAQYNHVEIVSHPDSVAVCFA